MSLSRPALFPSALSRLALASAVALAAAATAHGESATDFNDAPANVEMFRPAFDGQTRAPVIRDETPIKATAVTTGLTDPWGMAELPDGSWLVTERGGTLRRVAADGTLSDPISGTPEVAAKGQGGLLDVQIAPDFARSRRLWLSFAKPEPDGNHTAVATATLSAEGTALEGLKVIFQQTPVHDGDKHFGSRIVPDGKGGIFVTLGERSDVPIRDTAQADDNHLGKIVHIDGTTGAPAADSPGMGLPEIYAKGLRNVQAAALDASGQLWTIEHGPQGGDELNRIEPGKNYGWPVISYGQSYDGQPINDGIAVRDGMEQPVYYWDPVIAPSGMAFHDGAMFSEWKGSVLVGGMVAQSLVRLTMQDGKVTGEARYPQDERVRDVAVASDGSVRLLLDSGEMRALTRE